MDKKVQQILNHGRAYQGKTLIERLEDYHAPALSFVIIDDYKIACAYATGNRRYDEKQQVCGQILRN